MPPKEIDKEYKWGTLREIVPEYIEGSFLAWPVLDTRAPEMLRNVGELLTRFLEQREKELLSHSNKQLLEEIGKQLELEIKNEPNLEVATGISHALNILQKLSQLNKE